MICLMKFRDFLVLLFIFLDFNSFFGKLVVYIWVGILMFRSCILVFSVCVIVCDNLSWKVLVVFDFVFRILKL